MSSLSLFWLPSHFTQPLSGYDLYLNDRLFSSFHSRDYSTTINAHQLARFLGSSFDAEHLLDLKISLEALADERRIASTSKDMTVRLFDHMEPILNLAHDSGDGW